MGAALICQRDYSDTLRRRVWGYPISHFSVEVVYRTDTFKGAEVLGVGTRCNVTKNAEIAFR